MIGPVNDAEPAGPIRAPLTNHPSVGTGSAAGGKFLILFGLPFLAAGLFASLAGLGLSELEGNQAPPWVVLCFGLTFAVVGAGMIWVGARSMFRERRLKRSLADYAAEPWLFDGWDPQFARDLLAGVLQPFAVTIFLALFLGPFNYFVFAKSAPLFVKGMILLFDLALLASLGHAFYRLGRRVKYRDGRLRYRELPLLATRPMSLTLRMPQALRGRFERLEVVLRGAEQLWEQSGDAKSLMTYETYRDARTFSGQELEGELTLEYTLPEGAQGTVLHGDTVRFYELEITAETPGIDYRALYLLPIYR